MELTHLPVMLEEALEALDIRADGVYLDATFGRGGHSREILARLSEQGKLFAVDKDPAALASAQQQFSDEPRLRLCQASFADLAMLVDKWDITGGVDGVLMDLGVSSPQLDDPDRGFSFMADGPLDMRMNPDQRPSAAEWLAQAPEEEISRIIWEYGEERFARKIARSIVMARRQQSITRTQQLAQLVEGVVGRREKHKHPATRSFQAIRIHINKELDDLRQGLAAALDVLRPGGRLAVISFHSLEDRLVKQMFKRASSRPAGNRRLPVAPDAPAPVLRLLGRARLPSEQEVQDNPRARSAVLRVAERLP